MSRLKHGISWFVLGFGMVAGCGAGYVFPPGSAQAAEERTEARAAPSSNVYEFALNIDGKPVPLSRLRDKASC